MYSLFALFETIFHEKQCPLNISSSYMSSSGSNCYITLKMIELGLTPKIKFYSKKYKTTGFTRLSNNRLHSPGPTLKPIRRSGPRIKAKQ